MDKKKVIIIDGNSLMYRAFYGIRVLTTSKGVYTNAVFGFTNMLFNLVDQYQPDYIGVAFDLKGPTFRHEIYADYKANRQKTPEELLPQFQLLKSLLRAMNIAIYEMEGYEADDILVLSPTWQRITIFMHYWLPETGCAAVGIPRRYCLTKPSGHHGYADF